MPSTNQRELGRAPAQSSSYVIVWRRGKRRAISWGPGPGTADPPPPLQDVRNEASIGTASRPADRSRRRNSLHARRDGTECAIRLAVRTRREEQRVRTRLGTSPQGQGPQAV